jgi:chromatin segregation and condensation protein Rec8/ScpA/Scc1 (kleisin family)
MTQHDENFYERVFEKSEQYRKFLQEAAKEETTEVKRLQSDTGFSSTQIERILDLLGEDEIIRHTEKIYGGEGGYSETVEAVELPDYTRHALKHEDEQRYVKAMINLESR